MMKMVTEPADYVDISSDDTDGLLNSSLLGNSSSSENCSLYQNEYCESPEDYEDRLLAYIYPDHYEWFLISAHIVVFIVGLVGNALVCVSVFRNTSMRTVTNYFIVNLAVADFLVILVCLPPTVVWDVTATWFLGEALCKIVLYFQTVSVSVSVLTLTVISIERWYAICYPLKFKATTSRAKRLILLIWVISLIVDIPELIVLETRPPDLLNKDLDIIYFTTCVPDWPAEVDIAYTILKTFVLYLVPLLFMSFAYYQIVRVLWSTDSIPGGRRETILTTTPLHHHHSTIHAHQNGQTNGTNGVGVHYHVAENGNGLCRQSQRKLLKPILRGATTMSQCSQADYQLKSRRKAAKMLVAVVVMFGVCYLPVHVYSIFILIGVEVNHEYITYFAMISHWLCYANSAINPVIYNFMSGKFRKEFLRTFGCRSWAASIGSHGRGRRPPYRRGYYCRGGTQIRFQDSNGAMSDDGGRGSNEGRVINGYAFPMRVGSTFTASYRYALRTEFTPTRSTFA